ncbi:hypothetical protein GCM10010360_04810 [Streptomyces nogalater]
MAAVEAPEVTSAAVPRAGRRAASPTVPSSSTMYGSIGSQLGRRRRVTVLRLLCVVVLYVVVLYVVVLCVVVRCVSGVAGPLSIVLLTWPIGNPVYRSDCHRVP